MTDNNDVAEENVSGGQIEDKWKTCTYTWSFSLPILKFSVVSLASVQGKISRTHEALGALWEKRKECIWCGDENFQERPKKTALISESSLELNRKETVVRCRHNT